MSIETLANEARNCRSLALQYAGRPEQRLLLNAAKAFDELASAGKPGRGFADKETGPAAMGSVSTNRRAHQSMT